MTGYQSKRAAAQDKLVRMTHIEALKLAQQVLKSLPGFRADIDNALDAIKEALALPEQEPWPEEPFGHMAGGVQPAQEPWVGLTESERNDIEDYCEMIIGKAAFDAIEAKLQEKNT